MAAPETYLYESPPAMAGTVSGVVAPILRLEAGVALVLAVLAYHALGGAWWLFAVLFFVPDLSMLGYLVDSRTGAVIYNVGHSYLTPAVVAVIGFLLHAHLAYLMAAIWFAHIGFDRLLGFGLKYPDGFGVTHLGRSAGKARRT